MPPQLSNTSTCAISSNTCSYTALIRLYSCMPIRTFVVYPNLERTRRTLPAAAAVGVPPNSSHDAAWGFRAYGRLDLIPQARRRPDELARGGGRTSSHETTAGAARGWRSLCEAADGASCVPLPSCGGAQARLLAHGVPVRVVPSGWFH